MCQKKKEFFLFCSQLYVTLRLITAKLLRLGKKRNDFLLFCSQLSVTLASPKLLALGNEKKNIFSFCISLVFP